MDAVTDPTVHSIACIKGSQIGWTEILLNALGFFVHQDPAAVLFLQPTVEMAEAWSKERLAPMIRDTPAIKRKFQDPRSRDSGNTLRHKEFPGGYVAIMGANAPAGLASRPIRVVLGDEIDRFPASAGKEGDPLKLAAKRQTNFWNRKTLSGSTPTVKGASAIEREYGKSDMREFIVHCPYCGAGQKLVWAQVKWDKEETEDGKKHLPATAHYQCTHCGELMTDAEKNLAVSRGEWVATAPFTGVAGFHLSALYSPWYKLKDIVTEFIEALGNPELQKVFANTVLGESWEEQGEEADADDLEQRCEEYYPTDLPDEIKFATAGVDVQGDRIEVELVGWGVADRNWGISYHILRGDPSQQGVWDDLKDVIFGKCWTTGGRLVPVRATCIDTGGHHAAEVYTFCRKHKSRRVYPIKGAAGAKPTWPRDSSAAKAGNRVYIVGVDTAKESWYGRLGISEPSKPGYCRFPVAEEYNKEYFAQFTSEKVVTRYKEGRPYRVWVKKRPRNEVLDVRVYALAARQSLTNRLQRKSGKYREGSKPSKPQDKANSDADETKNAPDDKVTRKTRTKLKGRARPKRRKNFVNRW